MNLVFRHCTTEDASCRGSIASKHSSRMHTASQCRYKYLGKGAAELLLPVLLPIARKVVAVLLRGSTRRSSMVGSRLLCCRRPLLREAGTGIRPLLLLLLLALLLARL